MTLILSPPYLKTIIKHQTFLSIQCTQKKVSQILNTKHITIMLHLYYFESLLEQHGIFYYHKGGPTMMSIQVGYNKNYHRK